MAKNDKKEIKTTEKNMDEKVKNTEKIQEVPVVEEKSEVIEPVEEVKEDNEVELLKAQLEAMKKQMEDMAKSVSAPAQSIVIKEAEDEVTIGCRMLQGIGLHSDDGTIKINLSFNEEQTATINEMKKLLRQAGVKKAFEDGICYFQDEACYKIFNIKGYKDLSDESLIALLSLKDVNEIIRKLDNLTENKKESSVVNCIIYRICNMIRKKQLSNWDYYVRKGIEDYFKIEFDRGINILNSLDTIRN